MAPSSSDRLPCGRPKPRSGPAGRTPQAGLLGRLEAYLRRKKLNRSETRNRVVQVVLEQKSHFTAPELVKRVLARFPSVGAATVYRSLPVLVEAEILRESLSQENGQAVYELHGDSHHDHIVCLDCDAILEFHEARIESLQEQVLEGLGFRQARHKHVVYAHCQWAGGKAAGQGSTGSSGKK